MPAFCRHGRFESSCPICSMKAKKTAAAAPTRTPRTPRAPGATKAKPRRTRSGVSVTQMARAEDDGYDHDLVPGLRSSVDALRLAQEVALADQRLRVLREDPPGLYAEVARADDPLEAAWLAFLIAVLAPLEGDDPWAAIAAARTTFASGEIPSVTADTVRGPRAAPDPASALPVFRTWLARPDALAAETVLPANRRFDRLYERLGIPGAVRAQRYEFLVLCGALGVSDVEPSSLRLGEATDETTLAAKRVFAIGDSVLLGQRSAALAVALEVPLAALDLGLVNWARPERIATGVPLDGDAGETAATAAAALGV